SVDVRSIDIEPLAVETGKGEGGKDLANRINIFALPRHLGGGARILAAKAAQEAIASHAARNIVDANIVKTKGIVEDPGANRLEARGSRRKARQIEIKLGLSADTKRISWVDIERLVIVQDRVRGRLLGLKIMAR